MLMKLTAEMFITSSPVVKEMHLLWRSQRSKSIYFQAKKNASSLMWPFRRGRKGNKVERKKRTFSPKRFLSFNFRFAKTLQKFNSNSLSPTEFLKSSAKQSKILNLKNVFRSINLTFSSFIFNSLVTTYAVIWCAYNDFLSDMLFVDKYAEVVTFLASNQVDTVTYSINVF